MRNIVGDVILACRVSRGYEADISKIFYKTNENIADLLNAFDFVGKDVLTVMGSGDQVFHFLNKDPNKVDSFDRNILSIHYYYLRVWCMRYLNEYYPPNGFDNNFIGELLKIVEPLNDSEVESFDFWNHYLNEMGNYQGHLLKYPFSQYDNTIKDIKNINNKTLNPINFYNIDLMDKINIPNKYDYIYVSNIREWIWLKDVFMRVNYKNNLYNLLKDDGIVICSTLDHYPVGLDEEQSIFREQFSFNYVKGNMDSSDEKYRISPGYYYQKNKCLIK